MLRGAGHVGVEQRQPGGGGKAAVGGVSLQHRHGRAAGAGERVQLPGQAAATRQRGVHCRKIDIHRRAVQRRGAAVRIHGAPRARFEPGRHQPAIAEHAGQPGCPAQGGRQARRVVHGGGHARAERRLRAGQQRADLAHGAALVPEPVGLAVPPRQRRHEVIRASHGGIGGARQPRRPGDQGGCGHRRAQRREGIGRLGQAQHAEPGDARRGEAGDRAAPPGADRRLVGRNARVAWDVVARVERVGVPGRSKRRRAALEVHRERRHRQVKQQVQPMLARPPRQAFEPGGRDLAAERRVQVVQAGGREPVAAGAGPPRRRDEDGAETEPRRLLERALEPGGEEVDIADARTLRTSLARAKSGRDVAPCRRFVDCIHAGSGPVQRGKRGGGKRDVRRFGSRPVPNQSSRTPPVTAW